MGTLNMGTLTFRPTRRYPTDRERGAILPIMALLLVALLAMAAIVVDLGAARETSRRNQGSMDAAALGAAQDLPTRSAALTAALSIAASDLGLSPGATATALNSCSATTDPNALAVPATTTTAGANESCVTFDFSARQIRVYYAGTYTTAFGGVIGAKTLAIKNGATAQKSSEGPGGGVLPFGLAASGTGEVCLKSSSGGTATPPCAGGSSGNYGFLDVAEYGHDTASYICGSGSHDQRFQDNVASSIDHDLLAYGQTTPAYSDIPDAEANNNYCPTTPLAGPDHIAVNTGNVDPIITAALLTDTPGITSVITDTKGARPQRGSFVCKTSNLWSDGPTNYTCGTVEGAHVDDVPLWHFIGNTSYPNNHDLTGDVPTACAWSNFTTRLGLDSAVDEPTRATDMRALIDTCVNEYAYGVKAGIACDSSSSGCSHAPGCDAIPCTDVVFGYKSIDTTTNGPFDIQATPRFGYAPIVCTVSQVTVGIAPPPSCPSPFGSGNKDLFITRFAPVYIQRAMNSSSGLDFEPGVQYTYNGNKSADEIIGYSFPGTMLPGKLGDANAPNKVDVTQTVSLIR